MMARDRPSLMRSMVSSACGWCGGAASADALAPAPAPSCTAGEGSRRALLGEEVEHLVLEAPQRGLGEVRHLRRRQRGGDLGHEVREGLVRDGVDAHPGQLLLQLRVPVVLHVVVRPPRKLRRDHRPPCHTQPHPALLNTFLQK